MTEIYGHQSRRTSLGNLPRHFSLGRSFLFTGREGTGKKLAALEYVSKLLTDDPSIQKLICSQQHLDAKLFLPEGKAAKHSIASMRSLKASISIYPSTASASAYLIDDAHLMDPSSANALLKTLEEVPRHALIILISSSPEKMLPTILSRCIQIAFAPLTEKELATCLEKKFAKAPQESIELAKRSGGSLPLALAIGSETSSAEELFLFLQKERHSFSAAKSMIEQLEKKVQKECSSWEAALEKDFSSLFGEAGLKQKEAKISLYRRQRVLDLWMVFLDVYAKKGYKTEAIESFLLSVHTSFLRFSSLRLCLESVFLYCGLF